MASFLAKGGSLLTEPKLPDWADADATPADTTGDGKKYHIPGYTGFIPNSSEVAGRSYGRMTKRALNKPVRRLLEGDQIPSSPQASTKIHTLPTETVVGLAEANPRHIPGYTGFVPATRETFGTSYGSTTAEHVKRPIDSKNGRRALNKKSLERVSFPVAPKKPQYDIDATGLHMKFAPS